MAFAVTLNAQRNGVSDFKGVAHLLLAYVLLFNKRLIITPWRIIGGILSEKAIVD